MHRRLDAFRIAQHHSRTTDVRLVREFLREMEIPGRDGTVTLTGGAGGNRLCPWTNTVGSGPCTGLLSLPGVDPLTMYGAWDAMTNLCPAVTTDTGLVSNTLSGLARTLVEAAATSLHYSTSVSTFALTNSATYSVKFKVKRWFSVNRAAVVDANVKIDLDAGTIADVSSGGASTSNRLVTPLGGGSYLVTFNLTSAAWGGNARVQYGLTSAGALSYLGDGTSGVVFEAVTITQDTLAPLGMAEGITRSSDSVLYTLASALSQDEELIHIGWQPYADGDMGITSQMWIEGSAITNHPRLIRAGATQLSATLVNNVSASITDSITRTLPNAGILFVQRIRVRPTEVEVGYGPTLSGSPTAVGTPPWNSQTVIKIGHSTTAGRASRAMNTVLRVRSPTTIREYQAKVDAFCRMVHLKRLAPAA
jgi:hypothetical protein